MAAGTRNMYKTILIVEDNPLQQQQREQLLVESGYFVLLASDFETARRRIRHEQYDLLLLDLRLGERNGMEILSMVKRMDRTFPVVILSSISEIDEKVSAFEIGVDDYITKPYHPAELLLRVKRLLRDTNSGERRMQEIFSIGDIELDVVNGIVKKGKQQFFLRKKVLDLLLLLYENRDMVVSKERIIQEVWKDDFVEENVISVTVHEIRGVIEDDPKKPRYLRTVKGLGYKLEA